MYTLQDPYVFEEVEADTPLHSRGPLDVHNWQTEAVSAGVVCDSSSALFCRNLRLLSTPAAHLLQVGRNSNTSPAAFCHDSLWWTNNHKSHRGSKTKPSCQILGSRANYSLESLHHCSHMLASPGTQESASLASPITTWASASNAAARLGQAFSYCAFSPFKASRRPIRVTVTSWRSGLKIERQLTLCKEASWRGPRETY